MLRRIFILLMFIYYEKVIKSFFLNFSKKKIFFLNSNKNKKLTIRQRYNNIYCNKKIKKNEFHDRCIINVKGGNGGDGVCCFTVFSQKKNKKYASGGAGGKGGDVFLVGDKKIDNFFNLKLKAFYYGENGKNGSNNNQIGKNGKDEYIYIPINTLIYSDEKKFINFISFDGQKILISKGGKGGKGNYSFRTRSLKIPFVCQYGEKMKEKKIYLKKIFFGDFSIIGYPNVGKSTLLNKITKANVKIANYSYTSKFPNLGIFECNKVKDELKIESINYSEYGLNKNNIDQNEITKSEIHENNMNNNELNKNEIHENNMNNNELNKNEIYKNDMNNNKLNKNEIYKNDMNDNELNKNEIYKNDMNNNELNENEIYKNDMNDNQLNENEIHENDMNENELSKNEIHENDMNENEIYKNDMNDNQLDKNEIYKNDMNENELNENEIYKNDMNDNEIKDIPKNNYTIIDFPGIIENLNEKKNNISYKYLEHLKNSKVLIYMFDINNNNIIENYKNIKSVLVKYDDCFKDKKEVIVLNKVDLYNDKENINLLINHLKENLNNDKIFYISALTGENVEKTMSEIVLNIDDQNTLKEFLKTLPKPIDIEKIENSDYYNPYDYKIYKYSENIYIIKGKYIENQANIFNFSKCDSSKIFMKMLDDLNINMKLKNIGAKEGDKIIVSNYSYSFDLDY
ncbi:GTP-binding protein, putative [Plasmodium gallinaceum]|uniref:GTP-binding protein, putative n=1 Tax=Plasmodium gallinaceum TaxID=5849 RepID=A0A1J1GTR7_PLAGA|nr:GTP-binding protein, putative [Plasmodium gallinaceum]CRG95635.1 GTP-binding protein, putative [Plasmodium gallinaceum]